MGSTGSITIFTEHCPPSHPRLLVAICAHLGLESPLCGSICRASMWPEGVVPGPGQLPDEIEDWRFIAKPGPVEQVAREYQPGANLGLMFLHSPILTEVREEALALPREIIGDFAPGDMSVEVGPRDLFEWVGDLHYFGRSHAAVSLGGPGCPNNWAAARELLVNLPSVRALAERLEPIMGPVKICAYWDG